MVLLRIQLLRDQRKSIGFIMVCWGSNEQALVLHWFWLGFNEKQWFYNGFASGQLKNIGFTLVLLRVQRENVGFTCALLWAQRKIIGFTTVLLRAKLKTALVLHWFCFGSNEEHWCYSGFALGPMKNIGFTMVLLRAQRTSIGCTLVLLNNI